MTHSDTSQYGARVIVEKGGYVRERRLGGIIILRVKDSEPQTIDAWYEDCNKLMSRWQPDQKLRYLHDIRGAERITPHATDRVARVLRKMRYMPVGDGRGAILLTNPTIRSLLETFFKRRPRANWQIRFFTDEAEALRWLAE